MDLTKKDRLIIANQLKILQNQNPNSHEEYNNQIKVLENGYALHYDEIFNEIGNELSRNECLEVLKILEMREVLIDSFNALKDEGADLGELTEEKVRFHGFSGNEETLQMSYTRYFINDLERHHIFRDGNLKNDFNSHCPMLDIYNKQVYSWKNKYQGHRELTAEMITDILEVK